MCQLIQYTTRMFLLIFAITAITKISNRLNVCKLWANF